MDLNIILKEFTYLFPINTFNVDNITIDKAIILKYKKDIKNLDKSLIITNRLFYDKYLKDYNFKGLNSAIIINDNIDNIDVNTSVPIFHNSSNTGIENLLIDILNYIADRQSKIIENNNIINNAFIKMNIKQANIKDYIDLLSDILKKDIAYYGKLDSSLYFSNNEFITKEELLDITDIKKTKYYIYKIIHNAQIYGYILIDDFDKAENKEELIIEYTASMILIKIQNQIAIESSKEIVKSDLIADICMNNIKSKEEVSFRASLQGWNIDSGLLSVIFDIDDFKHNMLHSNKKIEELEEEKQVIFNLIINEMDKINYDSYYYRKSDSIIFLVNIKLENNLYALDNFINDNIKPIHEMLYNKGFFFTLTIGIGTYYKDIMQTYKSYNEAVEAINISRIFKEVNDICCYKDVLIYKDLMEVMSRKDYHSIYTNLIKNMRKLDEKNNTEYFETLQAIIKNDWNLKVTSEKLYIHYNTIIYRFEKIKSILGMQLNDFADKLIITLTVMILEVEKHIDFNKGMFKK